MSDFKPTPIPNGRKEIDGNIYMRDGKGGLQPIENIAARDLLQERVDLPRQPERPREIVRPSLMTVDGLYKVEVRVADHIDFGPELQIAKQLVDECLNEWSAESRPEIRSIVTRAFNTDKEGQINRAEVFMLLRLEISDARWQEAMRAIKDAIRVVGSKTYVRCSKRDSHDAAWQAITIDLAKA